MNFTAFYSVAYLADPTGVLQRKAFRRLRDQCRILAQSFVRCVSRSEESLRKRKKCKTHCYFSFKIARSIKPFFKSRFKKKK